MVEHKKFRESSAISKRWQALAELDADFPSTGKNKQLEHDFATLWNSGIRSPEQLKEITSDAALQIIIGRPLPKGYRPKLLSTYEGRLNTILYEQKIGKFS